jgi:arsenate reductase
MKKIRVLFVCVHNSARSQMAEAYLNHFAGDLFEAESAGFESGTLNPLVVEAMNLDGIDISHNQTNTVWDFYKQQRFYGYVITVCDGAQGQKCPIFPGVSDIRNWNLEDPSSFSGSHEEKLVKTTKVRDTIKQLVQELISELKQKHFR